MGFPGAEYTTDVVLTGQGLLTVNEPSAAEHLLKAFEQAGVKKLLDGYFGDDTCVSSRKWTLRRGNGLAFPGWHQDGYFMDGGNDYLNMWVALSHCGGDTGVPGLTVVPTRPDDLLVPRRLRDNAN